MDRTAEHELMVRCVSEAGGHNEISSQLDWDYVLEKSRLHGIAPLMYHYLRNAVIPEEAMENLRTSYHVTAARNIDLRQGLIEVLPDFQNRGIEVMTFRGSAQEGDHTGVPRPMRDIDIIVRERDLKEAKGILEARGFRPCEPGRQDLREEFRWGMPYFKGSRIIDLHVDYNTWGLYDIDMDDVWERAVKVNGRGIKTMGHEDHLLQTCVHLHKHGYDRLISLCDIMGMKDEVDWDRVLEGAGSAGMASPVYFSLFLTASLLGWCPPSYIMDALRPGSFKTHLFDAIWNREDFFEGRAGRRNDMPLILLGMGRRSRLPGFMKKKIRWWLRNPRRQ